MTGPRNPGRAAVLILIIPGVGQFCNGDFWRGVISLIVTLGSGSGRAACSAGSAITVYRRVERKNALL